MATKTVSLLKLVNNGFTENSSFVVNKGANGSTASAVLVFNTVNGQIMSSQALTMNSIKVGGQNLFAEEIKIEAQFGAYRDDTGFNGLTSMGSCTVAEGDGTTSRTITGSNAATVATGYYPAVKITVSSTKTARGAEVVMSGFSLKLNYTAEYTITTKVSGKGSVEGGGTLQEGVTRTLTAKPDTGYKFVKWNDGKTDNPRTITVTGNATYTAYFEKIPPEFTTAEMIYGGKQISQENKVIAGQSFIISVAVT